MKYILSIILFILISSITFEIMAFNSSFQDYLIQNSQRENRTIENQKILEFFKTGIMQLNMTEDELKHMHEVRNLNTYFELFIYLLLIIFVSILFIARLDFFEMLFQLWAPLSTFIIILVLGILLPSQMFTLFHSIFFPQGNYLFPTDSFLITLYPESYFFSLFYFISAIALSISLILIVIGKKYCKQSIPK